MWKQIQQYKSDVGGIGRMEKRYQATRCHVGCNPRWRSELTKFNQSEMIFKSTECVTSTEAMREDLFEDKIDLTCMSGVFGRPDNACRSIGCATSAYWSDQGKGYQRRSRAHDQASTVIQHTLFIVLYFIILLFIVLDLCKRFLHLQHLTKEEKDSGQTNLRIGLEHGNLGGLWIK